MLKIYVFLSLFMLREAPGIFFEKRVVKVDIFRNCQNKKSTAIELYNISISQDASRQTFINGKINVKATTKMSVFGSYWTHFILTRCRSRDSPDTCEFFTTLKVPNTCSAITVKGQFWSPLTQTIRPNLTCPPETGIYAINNGSFDIDAAPFPVNYDTYWKIRSETFHGKTKTITMCLEVEGSVVRFRN